MRSTLFAIKRIACNAQIFLAICQVDFEMNAILVNPMEESHAEKGSPDLSPLRAAMDKKINDQSETSLIDESAAFTSVAKDWLGLSGDEEVFETDGAGDRGIDCYKVGDSLTEIYQFKGKNEPIAISSKSKASSDMIKDINRIVDYIGNIENPQFKQNNRVINFQRNLQNKNFSYYENKNSEQKNQENCYVIQINLILGMGELTPQCAEEFNNIKNKKNISWREEKIQLKYNLLLIDDLLKKYWSLHNNQWKNREGKKHEKIEIQIIPSNIKGRETNFIENKGSTVAFVRALDLVRAYRELGYQIFEQNVRCQIKKSVVNSNIISQVQTEKGIKEFHTLNNGVTILAQNTHIKGKNILLNKPGVINGLQTITSLAEAYEKMDEALKKKFEEYCYVLARVFEKEKVSDPNKLVLATNTQNVMEDRNLKSNDERQIELERLFYDMDSPWFYERKEYAWEAFSSDPSRWPTLHPKAKKTSFQRNNRTPRTADNNIVAQSWLSFIGYAENAMHDKKKIFSDEKYYKGIFQMYPNGHGADFEVSSFPESVKTNLDDYKKPTADALLFTFLLHKLSKSIPISNTELKKEFSSKNGTATPEEERHNLLNNDEYLKGYLMNSAHYFFIEIVGFGLFKRYGNDLYNMFPTLLKESDMKSLYYDYDSRNILGTIKNKKFKASDSIALCWAMFEHLINVLVKQHIWWRDGYLLTSSRGRFLYKKSTRDMLITHIKNFEELVKEGNFDKPWSVYMLKKKDFWRGIFPFDSK